jgi:hypothetical protein
LIKTFSTEEQPWEEHDSYWRYYVDYDLIFNSLYEHDVSKAQAIVDVLYLLNDLKVIKYEKYYDGIYAIDVRIRDGSLGKRSI